MVTALHCAPGNAGTAALATNHLLDPEDSADVVALSTRVGADLVVIGPEGPLVAGVADAVRAAGIACFGPSAAAARIEGSKAFAKQLMREAGVPTAASESFQDAEVCAAYLAASTPPYVVKADGLAAGKGVLVTGDLTEAVAFARHLLTTATQVLVEDYLDGPEVSLFAITDGVTVLPMMPAQDHKRAYDGDLGPNTGGMGAYAPLPWLPDDLVQQACRRVLQPVIDRLRVRGTPFQGLLYAGLALTSTGLQVVEFNCRFGDPETQVVLALLETPLAGVLHSAATWTLDRQPALRWRPGSAVTVVVAAKGYPAAPVTGDVVVVGEVPEGVQVLHAGTRSDDGQTVSSGGRVLSVTAVGPDLTTARTSAYDAVRAISLQGSHFRRDVALAAAEDRITVPDLGQWVSQHESAPACKETP